MCANLRWEQCAFNSYLLVHLIFSIISFDDVWLNCAPRVELMCSGFILIGVEVVLNECIFE